jgi:hypothetical protein
MALLCVPFLVCDSHALRTFTDQSSNPLAATESLPDAPLQPLCVAHCLTHTLVLVTFTLFGVLALLVLRLPLFGALPPTRRNGPPLLPPPQFA